MHHRGLSLYGTVPGRSVNGNKVRIKSLTQLSRICIRKKMQAGTGVYYNLIQKPGT